MSAGGLDVLLIEDEPLDARLVQRSLDARAGEQVRVHHVPTLAAGLERLGEGGIAVVLLDLNVPDSLGLGTLARLRARDSSVPVVVFTSAGDDETALAALGAGAQDYVVKDELGGDLLHRAILHAVERRRLASEDAQLARRRLQTEKVESLGALCGGIAFGLNEELGIIFDQCSNALASLGAPWREPLLRHALLEIHRAAFRTAAMTQQLRDYSGIERFAEGDEVELGRFVLEAQELLASMVPAEIDVVCDTGGEALPVEIARGELHRILVSLVINASEAIGDRRGTVEISTGRLDVDEALLARADASPDARPGPHAFVRVADSGHGFEAPRRDRLFDPFYTTKRAGRGLGLSGALGILLRRRGAVCVEPNDPSGTVFTILLPLAQGPAAG